MAASKILIVEDEAPIREMIAFHLVRAGYETVEAGDMTKDLALLIGPDQHWLTTGQFFDKIDENLKAQLG